jgi:glutathione S-transferase
MKLYTFIGSTHCHKVEAVISHLGLDVEVEYLDLVGGELASAAYRALNPNGMVPLLVDGTLRLGESNAIMQYLADMAGSDALFPQDRRRRADIVRWQFWELAHFNKAFSQLAFETVARPRLNMGPTDTAVVERARVDLARFAPVLDQHLAGRAYMVGDDITLADYSVVTFESYRSKVPFDWSPYGNINAHFDRMAQAEHWRRAAVKDASNLGRRPRAA